MYLTLDISLHSAEAFLFAWLVYYQLQSPPFLPFNIEGAPVPQHRSHYYFRRLSSPPSPSPSDPTKRLSDTKTERRFPFTYVVHRRSDIHMYKFAVCSIVIWSQLESQTIESIGSVVDFGWTKPSSVYPICSGFHPT